MLQQRIKNLRNTFHKTKKSKKCDLFEEVETREKKYDEEKEYDAEEEYDNNE